MPKFEKTMFGAPCWVDLTNTNLAESKLFYHAVLGWDFTELGDEFGGYTIISRDGADLGGAMQYNAAFMGSTEINEWTVYFATENVEESLTAVARHGGIVTMPAMQVANQGISAEGTDPGGSPFGLWQPDQRKGFDRIAEPGFPAWFELQTREFEAVSTFYSAVLGAALGTEEMDEGMQYHTLEIDGQQTAGIWGIQGVRPDDATIGWMIYFAVDDPDTAVAAVREHGGKVISGPVDSGYGRMASVLDPAGTPLCLIKVNQG